MWHDEGPPRATEEVSQCSGESVVVRVVARVVTEVAARVVARVVTSVAARVVARVALCNNKQIN